jgi:hypothetical protein
VIEIRSAKRRLVRNRKRHQNVYPKYSLASRGKKKHLEGAKSTKLGAIRLSRHGKDFVATACGAFIKKYFSKK